MAPERYGKPNMTNMPSDLGRRVFKQILSSSVPNYEKLEREADKLEKKMIAAKKKHEQND